MSKDIYDVPLERQQVLRANAARRMELRNYFLKESSNPFKIAAGDKGHLFDPAIQRYQALKVTEYERFKPNLKTFKHPFLLFILPYAITTYMMYTDRRDKEARFRRGEVSYKDRNMKFL
ncbi:uncharacterized protein LOC123314741 [Coccinella septempunctata]|uniref:uncharacterized protein LOC123314741 n=1 Tax=Coccinella septempunctata TaxID=41139 RepID=UPI001D06A31C|nr:uncharacterized protein LOC123314741 [Coccinella septempunctata]